MISDKIFTKLKKLEESLWISVTRNDREYLDSILTQDFFEYGKSGNIYNREEILSSSFTDIKCTIPLINFSVKQITDDVFLVTYVSEINDVEVSRANRSSLWVKTNLGFKLKFHQGTPTKGTPTI